ncbi:MAG: hypothetical protein IH845_05245 [Nanoarchaeota archaeon]|nr:hypothetical protein [Nanoarchaeota archaeon]
MGILGDEVGVIFYMKATKPSKELVERIFNSLEEEGGKYVENWGVQVYINREKYKDYDLKKTSLNKMKEILSKEEGAAAFDFKEITLDIRILSKGHGGEEEFGSISLSCHHTNLEITGDENEDRDQKIKAANKLVSIAKKVWNSLDPKPLYGLGENGYAIEEILQIIEKVNELSPWVVFYGSEFIEKIGKEKLLNAPAYRVEEVDEGVLIMTSPLRSLPDDMEDQDTTLKTKEYFGWKKEESE